MSEDAFDPSRREQLEQERDFLMKSLDDLELERESGGIDEESYTQLHDDYTARAAAVLRTLRDGVDVTPTSPAPTKRTARRRLVVVSLVVVFALVAGGLLALAVGARLPGQTGSGNTQPTATTNASSKALAKKIDDLQAKVNASPDDYQLRLDLALAYEENGDITNALKQSDAAISIDADRPEGHTNLARLLYLVSEQLPSKKAQAQYVAQALAGFNKAIEVGPDYADAYYLRGVLYAFGLKDNARSQVDLQNYLLKAPSGRWADNARTLLAQVTKALESPSTTVPSTTTKPSSTSKK
jgi:tetratricopeptide (TPR) repeat protein